ncbi:MAG: hypothetical protein AAF211_08355, partial [Myxococcota bacterium]
MMATRAMVGFTPPNGLDLVVEGLDPSVVGREATVEVVHTVTVHDSRPVNESQVIWSDTVTLEATDLILPITLSSPVRYAWDGPQVTVDVVVTLKFPSSGWFSSDEVLAQAVAGLPRLARGRESSDPQLMEPKDTWSFELAVQSLGPAARQKVATQLGLFVAGSVAGLTFALWTGWCMLLFVWVVGSLIGGKIVYDRVMEELRGYAQLAWGFVPPLDPESVVPLRKLLDGVPRIDIERPILRIVACNVERGQYKRGSGTDVRTVSFEEPVGVVVLYESEIPRWTEGTPLSEAFVGEVDFGVAFRELAPPQSVGPDHGIGLRWEAHLIVPDLVD